MEIIFAFMTLSVGLLFVKTSFREQKRTKKLGSHEVWKMQKLEAEPRKIRSRIIGKKESGLMFFASK